MAGDETALPAISTILEGLPNGREAIVFVEVDTVVEEQPLPAPRGTRIHWRHRADASPPGLLLRDAICGTVLPPGPGNVFVAAEAFAVQAIRN